MQKNIFRNLLFLRLYKITNAGIAVGIYFFSINTHVFSQTWHWAKNVTGTGSDEVYSISVDVEGNVFITGYFNSPAITFGSTTLINTGTYDLFIAKYDASGNAIWAKSAAGMNNEGGLSISADKDGNVFITGYFFSATITIGAITLTRAGSSGSDIFIVKYDANGNLLWAKSVGGTGQDRGTSVSTDAGGNAFVTGYFSSSTLTFGSVILNNTGIQNIFIVKYNAAGNVLWAKSAAGTSSDVANAVSTDAGGNAFVTGYFNSPVLTFGATILANTGPCDVFIAKYDAAGNVLWAKSAAGTLNDGGYSISADANGNVFVTGYFDSPSITFGFTALTNTGFSDVFIAKYDALGNLLWAKSATGAGSDYGYSISTDLVGNAFVAGGFNSPTIAFGSDILTSSVMSVDPMFIIKYDGAGNVLCALALESGGDDESGVSTDSFGNAYIGNDFETNPFTIGSNTFVSAGEENIFIAKYSCGPAILTTGVSHINSFCSDQCTGAATAIASGGNSFYTYNWSNGQTTETATGLCSGNYTVTISDGTSSSTNTVSITDISAITATTSSTAAPGGTATAHPSGGTVPYSYLWNTIPVQTTQIVTGLEAGVYCCTITDANNCSGSVCAIVEAACGEIYVPTAFSPNDDKQNDLECVFGNCMQKMSFTIYDRWGNKIFETNDSKTCWNGTYKGKPMNTDVFAYYLEAILANGKQLIKKGNISLVR